MKASMKTDFSAISKMESPTPDNCLDSAHFRTHAQNRCFFITIEDGVTDERHTYSVNAESPAAALRLILQRGL